MTEETKKHLEFVPEVDKHHRRRRETVDKILDITANVTEAPATLTNVSEIHVDDEELNCHLGGPGNQTNH